MAGRTLSARTSNQRDRKRVLSRSIASRSSTSQTLAFQEPFLSREDENILGRRVAIAVAEGRIDREAERSLACSHLALVAHIASRFHGGSDYDDLASAGFLGLVRAIRGFDPDSGFRLSTYASGWIVQAIQRYMDCQGYLTPYRIPVAQMEYIRGHPRKGRSGKLDTDRSRPKAKAFDINSRAERTLGVASVDLGGLEDAEFATAAIEQLPEPEQKILRWYLGFDDSVKPTYQAIGVELGTSRETVRKLVMSGKEKLREYARSVGCL